MAINQAQIQKYVISAALVLVVLYAITNFTDTETASKFGLKSQKV